MTNPPPAPDAEPDAPHRVKLPRIARPAAVIGVLVLVATAIAAAFYAGTRIQAPAGGAEREGAPTPPVTARVESRVVQEGLQVPGKIAAPRTLSLTLAGEGVLGGLASPTPDPADDRDADQNVEAAASDAERNVISQTLTEPGERLSPGMLLAEVSGRPVIAVRTGAPLYRDFTVGISGADVLAFQQMLADLGYPVDLDGVFDADTLDTAAYWYGQLGYALPQNADGERGVPWRELLPLPSGTLTVVSPTGAGAVLGADTSIASVRRGDPVVEATVDATQVAQVRDASSVYVLFDGQSVATKVLSVGDLQTDEDSGISTHTVKVMCPEALLQQPGGTAVAIATAKPKTATLAVPVTALDEDGASQFVRLAADDEQTDTDADAGSGADETSPVRVDVEVLAVAAGWAAIAENPDLPEGTEVRVE